MASVTVTGGIGLEAALRQADPGDTISFGDSSTYILTGATPLFRAGTGAITFDTGNNSPTIRGGALTDPMGGKATLVKSGNGTLTLAGANTYTGGTLLESDFNLNRSTLELAVPNADSTGPFTFGAVNTVFFGTEKTILQIDNPALTSGSYLSAITGFGGADKETVDLAGLGLHAGATATLSGSTLTVTSGGVTDTLTNFAIAPGFDPARFVFKTVQDAATGGTDVVGAANATNVTQSLSVNQQSADTQLFTTPLKVTNGDDSSVTATLRLDPALGTLGGIPDNLSGTGVYTVTNLSSVLGSNLDAVTFTPTRGYNGPVTIGLSLSSGLGQGETGQVTVTVRPVIVGDVPGGTYIVNDNTTAILPGPNGANETELSSVSNAVAPGVGTMQLVQGSAATGIVATSGNHTLIGNDNGDVFVAQNGTDFLYGGRGNDIFNVDSSQDQIIEQPGGGYDTVYSSANFHLSDNVEALHLVEGSAARVALGNSGDNSLYANSAGDVLNGLGGNDTLYGGAGVDTFQFSQTNFGHQTVMSFDPSRDNLSFAKFIFSDYSAISGHLAQSGSDVLVLTGNPNNYVTIKNMQLSSLSAKDFSFFGSGSVSS